MLSMELFREEPERIKQSEKRREKDPSHVDKVRELDEEWREARQRADSLRQERNELSRKVAEKKQEGEDVSEQSSDGSSTGSTNAFHEIERVKEIKQEIERLEEREKDLKQERDEVRYQIGNLLHESVPSGEDEEGEA